ncbi:unnamed protein product, partial [Cylindrotheca closterium]
MYGIHPIRGCYTNLAICLIGAIIIVHPSHAFFIVRQQQQQQQNRHPEDPTTVRLTSSFVGMGRTDLCLRPHLNLRNQNHRQYPSLTSLLLRASSTAISGDDDILNDDDDNVSPVDEESADDINNADKDDQETVLLVHQFVARVQESIHEQTFSSLVLRGVPKPQKAKPKTSTTTMESSSTLGSTANSLRGVIRQVQGRLIMSKQKNTDEV